jgi:hypothetical protein
MILSLFEKTLQVLKHWSLNVDLDATNRVEILSKDQINKILKLLSSTEEAAAIICMNKNRFNESENYCQQALLHARRYDGEGENKTTLLLKVLTMYCHLRMRLVDFADGVIWAELAYNCVAVACQVILYMSCLRFKSALYIEKDVYVFRDVRRSKPHIPEVIISIYDVYELENGRKE